MLWRLLTILTPDQWSALGTVVSAVVAGLNLVVVILLLRYTISATKSAQAQAEVAVRTLGELNIEKARQNNRELMRVQGRLKDLGDNLLLLKDALLSVHFNPNEWEVKPSDWHEITDVVVRIWSQGIPKISALELDLRGINLRLRRLHSAPIDNANDLLGKRVLKDLVQDTHARVMEIWDGMMSAAT